MLSLGALARLGPVGGTCPGGRDSQWHVALLAGDSGEETKLEKAVIPVDGSLCCAVLVVNIGGRLVAPLSWLVSWLVAN